MAFKRKRSDSEALSFSSPLSDSSSVSTLSAEALPFFFQQSKPVESLYAKPSWAWPTYQDDRSCGLNSRTRKRHRDDRPDENAVHGMSCWLGSAICMNSLAEVCRVAASTIGKLFDAQRLHPNASPVFSNDSHAVEHPPQPQQNTLHSFWHINAPPMSAPMSMDSPANTASDMQCADCDGSLRSDDAMDVDGEMLARETACQSCGRYVCDTCAVLGNQRTCLGCANRGSR